MKKIVIILFIIGLFSCKNEKSRLKDLKIGRTPPKFVIVDKYRTDIHNDTFKISAKSQFFGKWRLEKDWSHFDTCWDAHKYIDYYREFVFTENLCFYFKEFENGKINKKVQGSFRIDTSGRRLALLLNDKQDTIFERGDPCVFKFREVYSSS